MVFVGAWQKWAANPGGRPSREVRYKAFRNISYSQYLFDQRNFDYL
jgi:hypothetical protein